MESTIDLVAQDKRRAGETIMGTRPVVAIFGDVVVKYHNTRVT